ncbi:MAG: hypothetical protein AB2746_21240 [Candidatus Thiodiazotropha taylori]
MAFPVIRESLKIFFEVRQKGAFPLRGGTIIRNQQNPRGYQMIMDRADFPSQAD